MIIDCRYVRDRKDLMQVFADLNKGKISDWSWGEWKLHPYGTEYAWIIDQAAPFLSEGACVLDAGGGQGCLQGYLSLVHKAQVVNVSEGGEYFPFPDISRLTSLNTYGNPVPITQIADDLLTFKASQHRGTPKGFEAFDCVVAASSIEHNPIEKIIGIIRNLLSQMRAGAPFIASVPVGLNAGWYDGGPDRLPGTPIYSTYLFSPETLRLISEQVKDLAYMIHPNAIPADEDYKRLWHAQKDLIKQNPSLFPGNFVLGNYVSGGFVLLRK